MNDKQRELYFIGLLLALTTILVEAGHQMLGSSSSAPPGLQLEDSRNAAATPTSEFGFSSQPEAVSVSHVDDSTCFRCYEHVKKSQTWIAALEELERKEKSLISQRHKILASSASSSSSSLQFKQSKQANRTRSMSQLHQQQETAEQRPHIVVSTLRVARSPANNLMTLDDEFRGSSSGSASSSAASASNQQQTTTSNGSKKSRAKNKIEAAIKQVKQKYKQQVNETCRTLYVVQQCLEEISDECIGDLQFHSQEVFAKQWVNRLNCPPRNNPTFKLFAHLTRSIPKLEDNNKPKIPTPRQITSDEEVRKRLNAILGVSSPSGNHPIVSGVVLRPTLSGSASHRFNSLDGSAVGGNRMRHHLAGEKGTTGDYNAEMGQSFLGQLAISTTTSQLLLIPCFLLIVMIALLTRANACLLANHQHKKTSTTTSCPPNSFRV